MECLLQIGTLLHNLKWVEYGTLFYMKQNMMSGPAYMSFLMKGIVFRVRFPVRWGCAYDIGNTLDALTRSAE